MDETKKTLMFAAAAAALLVIAILAAPRQITPEEFQDLGQQFFPEFTDPNRAITLEVIEFDPETGEPKPFKVTFSDGRWTIPSHHNYPADGEDRLAQTAAAVIDITKADFRSDNPADHEQCGVIDPLDESAVALTGRGTHVILKDENDNVLADIIVGDEVEGRPGFRFVRLPDQKRTYVAKVDYGFSTNFAEWIDTDLLQVEKNNIDRVTLLDYSINERTRTINDRDKIVLSKSGTAWSLDKTTGNRSLDTTKVKTLLTEIDNLSIVGVRPKPEGISGNLTASGGELQLDNSDLRSLQSKGFFFTRDGELKSNEGELWVRSSQGVNYILRFGEILYGTGLAVSAGNNQAGETDDQSAENRYLFITAQFAPEVLPEPPKPPDMEFQKKADSLWTATDHEMKKLYDTHEKWRTRYQNAQNRTIELNQRFADWYYVISADSFEKLRLKRNDLLISPES